MKKKFLIAGIVLLLIIGVCLIYFLLTQDWRGNDNLKYFNTEHGYNFQYSPDWNLAGDSQADIIMLYNTKSPPGDGGVPTGIKVDVMILENYDKLSLEDWINELSQRGPEQETLMEENITVDGIKAIRRTISPTFVNQDEGDQDEGAPISIYFMKENNIIMINYLGREPDYSAQMGNFKLILSTFNFK